MTTIGLATTDQLLRIAQKPEIASGDKNSVALHVVFDAKWNGYGKSAVFYNDNDETVYEIPLISGKCTVPHEVLENPGILFIGVRGVKASNNAVKTSSIVKYKIVEGAPVGDGTTLEPTADVYQQILTAYGLIDARITETNAWVDELTEVSAVYIGSGDMPENYKLQIDPEGEVLEMDTEIKKDSKNPVENKAIYSALAKKADSYKSLGELGIAVGKETIEKIANAMQQNTMLAYSVGDGSANIYPYAPAYGIVKVTHTDTSRTLFEYTSRTKGESWVGVHSNKDGWTGWVRTATGDDVLSINSDIASLENEVSVIKSSNAITDNALARISEQVSTLENDVAVIKSSNAITDNGLASVSEDVGVLKPKVEVLEINLDSAIKQIQTAINDLITRVTAIEYDLKGGK